MLATFINNLHVQNFMTTVKKHDFIEIDYTGKTKDDNFIFDTTEENVAKDNDLYEQKSEYSTSEHSPHVLENLPRVIFQKPR